MTNPQSQISQVVWEIADELCPRIIVIDGLLQCVSTIDRSPFFGDRLWLPSPIKIISSKTVYENESIKSVVIENV
jgi:hypothetical protein